ncbi:MAG: O-antigen ligase family protein [Azospirillaceae bacterium]|nr:O-antigen ligase family protein [Azospirillaceae bacterium]
MVMAEPGIVTQAPASLTWGQMVFRLLLAAVVLTPLALGGQRPWAWSVMAVWIGVVVLLWAAAVARGHIRVVVPMRWLSAPAIPFALMLLWAFVQTLDVMPVSWWHPLWSEAATGLGAPVSGSISLDPTMTRTALLRVVCYAAVFWLAVQLCRERARARMALTTLAAAGILYAVYGLVVFFSDADSILWLRKWAYHGDLTATFVNRDAYGTYAGLGILCCLAVVVHSVRRRHRSEPRELREVAESLLLETLPAALGGAVIGLALVLCHSRGAFVATAVATLALLGAALEARLIRARVAVLLCFALACVVVAVLAHSGDLTLQRLAETPDQIGTDDRSNLYRLTEQAIEDAPWLGHGFGAFLPAFRIYRDVSLPAPTTWEFAHDVFLETAMDLGLPAAGLWFLSLAIVVGRCVWGLRQRRRDRVYPVVAIAAAVLVGADGLVDFSAQIPAVAVTLALLLGMGYAQSWPTGRE